MFFLMKLGLTHLGSGDRLQVNVLRTASRPTSDTRGRVTRQSAVSALCGECFEAVALPLACASLRPPLPPLSPIRPPPPPPTSPSTLSPRHSLARPSGLLRPKHSVCGALPLVVAAAAAPPGRSPCLPPHPELPPSTPTRISLRLSPRKECPDPKRQPLEDDPLLRRRVSRLASNVPKDLGAQIV